MRPRPRICPTCRKEIPLDAEVRYSAAGVFHEACFQKGGRRR